MLFCVRKQFGRVRVVDLIWLVHSTDSFQFGKWEILFSSTTADVEMLIGWARVAVAPVTNLNCILIYSGVNSCSLVWDHQHCHRTIAVWVKFIFQRSRWRLSNGWWPSEKPYRLLLGRWPYESIWSHLSPHALPHSQGVRAPRCFGGLVEDGAGRGMCGYPEPLWRKTSLSRAQSNHNKSPNHSWTKSICQSQSSCITL